MNGAVEITARPQPPAGLLDPESGTLFLPAPEVVEWARGVFLDETSDLFNERHGHLENAAIGCLWTNSRNIQKQRRIVGQAEIPRPPVTGGPWARARWQMQLEGWFGEIPDFLVILDAFFMAQADDTTFCATVEHELCHCGQALDDFGAPAFTRDGEPKFAIVGHDVEEFVDIVRRYGAGAAAGDTAALVAAARSRPLLPRSAIDAACGTCLRAA